MSPPCAWYGGYPLKDMKPDRTLKLHRSMRDIYLRNLTKIPICLTRTISHCEYHLYMEPPWLCHKPPIPPGNIAWNIQHPQRPGLRVCAGHLGGTDWRLWPKDSDRDQDHQPGLLLQNVGIRCGVLVRDHSGGWRRARGVFRKTTWQKWTFIGVRNAYIFFSFWPFYEYLYLVYKYSFVLIIIF